MVWNVTTHRTHRVCCYYLLILRSWRTFPARNTKGYARIISTSINANSICNLITHLYVEFELTRVNLILWCGISKVNGPKAHLTESIYSSKHPPRTPCGRMLLCRV